MMAGYARMKGTPAPRLGWAVAESCSYSVGELAAWLSSQHRSDLLVIFLLPTSFMIHNFWTIQDPQAKMAEMSSSKRISPYWFAFDDPINLATLAYEPWAIGGQRSPEETVVA